MKSSTGKHYIGLDHVRALAAFMVFAWHFTHGVNGVPVSFEYVPTLVPFALIDEGHTGVALFMTLSGYLFAKLLNGKSICYGAFLWNRAVRLLPLLIVVLTIVGIKKYISGGSPSEHIYAVAKGALLPTLPNGAWSITVEFHFYLILPVFLWMMRKSKLLPFSIIAAAIALRVFLHNEMGEVQTLAYKTIVGRVDQFAFGMLAFQYRAWIANRHVLAIGSLAAFMLFYWHFDAHGGFYGTVSYPSPSQIWILLPTIEGAAYAVGIAWYDNSFRHSTGAISRFVATIGEYSYSIYLLHFFVVFQAARFVHERIMPISELHLALLWSIAFFLLMMLPGYLSFRYIEGPFLKLRRRYVIAPQAGKEDESRAAAQDIPEGVPELTRG